MLVALEIYSHVLIGIDISKELAITGNSTKQWKLIMTSNGFEPVTSRKRQCLAMEKSVFEL